MKDNKLLNFGKDPADEEQTTFQKIIEEVKQGIFGVYYLLLKNNEQSFWKYLFILLIEYLQLFSFTFDESVQASWKADGVITYFTQFLCTFRVVYWLRSLSWEIYLIIFYICIFLVFVIIIDFVYVSIQFRLKRLSFTQPVQILNVGCQLLSSVLFIPVISLFLSISNCSDSGNGTGLAHNDFPEVLCFQSLHIVHALISYFALFIFAIIVLLSCYLCFENRYSMDVTSRMNIKTDLLLILEKAVLVFFFTLLNGTDSSISKAVILVIFSTAVFVSYATNRPYFNPKSQLICELFSGLYAWANWVLLFSQIITDTQFTGSLEILFLGLPIICTIFLTREENRNKLLMTSEKVIENGGRCQMKNAYYIFIIDTREVIRESSIILKGYVNHHTQVCPFDTCPIKAYKKLMQRDKTMTRDRKRQQKLSSGSLMDMSQDNNSLLLAQAKALYLNGIRKFPNYLTLRIDYANFLQSRLKDRKSALCELDKAEQERPGFDHQFRIFRLRKIIEDELAEGHQNGGVDFIAAMNFESTFKSFKQLIEKSANLHFEFWSHLQEDSPNLVRLSTQGAKVNQSILAVESGWKKLQQMSTSNPKAIKIYATYLIEVLNDKESGNEQMMKAKEAANLRVNFDGGGAAANQEADVNSYVQDGTPCIYISGESDHLGEITQCNVSACKIFGYLKKEQLLHNNIKMLQPTIYSDHHDDFLNASIEKSPDSISSRERQIFGKHFTGYIFPIWLQIKNITSLMQGRQYVATFKIEKTGINKSSAYLLFNHQLELMDISPSCIQILGLNYDTFFKKQVYFDVEQLFPQLFMDKKMSSTFLSKVGAPLTYFYPRYVEYVHTDVENANKVAARSPSMGTAMAQDEDISQNPGQDGEEEYTGYEFDRNATQNIMIDNSNSLQKDAMASIKDDDDNQNLEDGFSTKYLYRTMRGERRIEFLASGSEINFELINFHGGYFLRLEPIVRGQGPPQANNMAKQLFQPSFQFSYDPIFKRFTRELRDPSNRHFLTDHNYLDLKTKKELCLTQQQDPADPNLQRFANMSYIIYLGHKQRMIERGDTHFDFDENEDDGQSEDDSEMSSGFIVNDIKGAKKEQTAAAIVQAQVIAPQTLGGLTPLAANADYSKLMVAGEGFGREFIKSEIERLIRVLQDKQQCAKDVHTFIRKEGPYPGWEEDNNQKAGLFSDRGGDIDKVDHESELEEREQGQDRNEKAGDQDSLKANIKSKKAFSMAINDKAMPVSLMRLNRTAQILLIALISIAIIEYAIMFKHFKDTESSFLLIEKAFERTAELQKVAFNARSMILLKTGQLKDYAGFATIDEYVTSIKAEFSSSLDLIYKIQNDINLSQLPLSDDHDQLLNNKTVALYFKEGSDGKKALMFSLTEAILQVSSTIFTISNMKVADFAETNEDVFFLMYNSFNDFLIGLQSSSNLYVQELNDRSSQREEIGLVLYILVLVALVLTFLVLIPVIQSVNDQKDRVLSLFCEIDNAVLKILTQRCEAFINNMSREEGSDDIESNAEMEEGLHNEEDEDYLMTGGGIQGNNTNKKPKGKSKAQCFFYFKFLIIMLIIQAYYLHNFILNTQDVDRAVIYSTELNVTAYTEPYYWLALNTQRELLNDPNSVVLNQKPLTLAVQTVYQLYDQQNNLQSMHLANKNYYGDEYNNKFEGVMRDDLCTLTNYFKANSTVTCGNFISGSLTQGLHVVIVRYFETLRNSLNTYQEFKEANNTVGIKAMVNDQSYRELCNFHFIDQPQLQKQLNTS